MAACSTLRIDAPRRQAFDNVVHVEEVFWTKKATSGGSSETPTEKLDVTMTCGFPSCMAEIAAIPEGK